MEYFDISSNIEDTSSARAHQGVLAAGQAPDCAPA
jgi:hypothetical protein